MPLNSENCNSSQSVGSKSYVDGAAPSKAARYSDSLLESGINRLVGAVNKLGSATPLTEMPPVYPYDSGT